jgi:hypothetical protein
MTSQALRPLFPLVLLAGRMHVDAQAGRGRAAHRGRSGHRRRRGSQGAVDRRVPEVAVLVAEEVRIEGPPGLMAHCVIQQNAEFFDYEAKTTPGRLPADRDDEEAWATTRRSRRTRRADAAVERRLVVSSDRGPAR